MSDDQAARHPGDQLPRALPALLPLGLDGVLARFDSAFTPEANRAARAFAAEAARLPGVTDLVPALASTLVRFDPLADDRADILSRLQGLLSSRDWLALPEAAPLRRWHLPVSFDGEDAPGLAQAAAATGQDPARAVEDVLSAAPRVLAIGFAPGQPYLGLLPEPWDFPRQAALSDVPAGALTVAIRQLVLFTNPSPTGWLQIGRSSFRPFQPGAADPMPLRSGDEIRFHRVSSTELSALDDSPLGGARMEVLS